MALSPSSAARQLSFLGRGKEAAMLEDDQGYSSFSSASAPHAALPSQSAGFETGRFALSAERSRNARRLPADDDNPSETRNTHHSDVALSKSAARRSSCRPGPEADDSGCSPLRRPSSRARQRRDSAREAQRSDENEESIVSSSHVDHHARKMPSNPLSLKDQVAISSAHIARGLEDLSNHDSCAVSSHVDLTAKPRSHHENDRPSNFDREQLPKVRKWRANKQKISPNDVVAHGMSPTERAAKRLCHERGGALDMLSFERHGSGSISIDRNSEHRQDHRNFPPECGADGRSRASRPDCDDREAVREMRDGGEDSREDEDQIDSRLTLNTPGAFAVNRSRVKLMRRTSFDEEAQSDSDSSTPEVEAVDERDTGIFDVRAEPTTLAPATKDRKSSRVASVSAKTIDDAPEGLPLRRCVILFIVLGAFAVIVVIALSVILTRGDGRVVRRTPPTQSPVAPKYNATRLLALAFRLQDADLPFSLVSEESLFALDWLANHDTAMLDVEHVDETQLLQRFALAALYNTTSGPGWKDQCGFLSPSSVCEWHCIEKIHGGVTCDDKGIVRSISLASNKLSGIIPESIGALSSLKSLSLRENKLRGVVGAEIGSLTALTYLNLATNNFDAVSSEIGQLESLEIFQLEWSGVKGALPSEIGRLSSLLGFFVANTLTGTLPTELGSMANLRNLYIVNTRISGELPSEIGNLVKLETMELAGNRIEGTLPTEFGLMTSARSIDLRSNSLNGGIPSEIGRLSSLTIMDLADNKLTGSIPPEVSSLFPELELVVFGNNIALT